VAGIAMAENGSINITGRTESVGFPTTFYSFEPSLSSGQDGYVAKLWAIPRRRIFLSARMPFPESTYGGISDGFAAKLDPIGSSLVYATFLGGERIEPCDAVALDSSGNLWVIGKTESPDFPVAPSAFMETHGGVADAFVVEIGETGSEPV
jgi:hypothetical protein